MDSIFDLDHLYRTYFKMALPSVFGLMVSVVWLYVEMLRLIARFRD